MAQKRPRIKHIKGKYYDLGTTNTSFLQLAMDLQVLGVQNYYFMLEIKDYSIAGVDPYQCDEHGRCTLTKDQIERIIVEVSRNPWYYLREVSRIEDQGNPLGIPYKANRGNIAQAWLFLHGIDSWLNLPRQQGKTQSALAIENWSFNYGTTNSTFIFVNKSGPDSNENLKRVGDQIDLLPEYLQPQGYVDENGKNVRGKRNATKMENAITNNTIITKPQASSPDKATSLARGLTAPIIHFDEVEFTPFINIIVANSVSTYETAARNAKHNGGMYGRIFTSTPGDMDSEPGIAADRILQNTIKWTEEFYDKTTEEMEQFVKEAGGKDGNGIVYIEFQYYQIGLTRAWMENICAKIGDKLISRREILLQRLHGSSLSPYEREDIEYIVDNAKKPIDRVYINEYYGIDIYTKLDKSIPYIMSIDCATGTNGDNNAITFLNPYTVMPEAEFECSYIGETKFEELIVAIVEELVPRAIVVIERNSVGDGIIDHLMTSRISSRLYFDKSADLLGDKLKESETIESMLKKQAQIKRYYGVYTGTKSREVMFDILSRHVNEFKDKFVTQNIVRDLSKLIRMKSGKIAAAPGAHDDSIMSYLIGLYVFYHGNNFQAFGFEPGKNALQEKNKGLFEYDETELRDVLPERDVEVIQNQKKVQEVLNYDEILKKAIMDSQKETSRLAASKFLHYETEVQPIDMSVDDDLDGSFDLSLFDTLND